MVKILVFWGFFGVSHNSLPWCPFLQTCIFVGLLQWEKTDIFKVQNLIVLTPKMDFSAKISLAKVSSKYWFNAYLCPKRCDKAGDFPGLLPKKGFKTSHFQKLKTTSLVQFWLKIPFLRSKLTIFAVQMSEKLDSLTLLNKIANIFSLQKRTSW